MSPPVRILLCPHDPAWAEAFAREREALLAALTAPDAQRVRLAAPLIEHIGSTAVPGLDAKPVIDMQIGVGSLAAFDVVGGIARIESLGYRHHGEYLAQLPFRRFFSRRPEAPALGYHIHLVAEDHPWWGRHLAFRDYLRSNAAARASYARTKHELAAREWATGNDYAQAKTECVLALEEEAFAWMGLSEATRAALRASRIG